LSGPPYYPPTSGAVGRRGRAAIALGVVAVALLLAGGVMTALFVTKSGELDRTRTELSDQVARRDTTISDHQARIRSLEQQLQEAKDEVEDVRQELTGTQNAKTQVETEKAAIVKCLDLVEQMLASTTQSQFEKRSAAAEKACAEAEKYL
jgi:chromosome segregation ATPase